jgi:hypothetical protein
MIRVPRVAPVDRSIRADAGRGSGVDTSVPRNLVERGTGAALRAGLDQLVRRNLRGVWVRGDLPLGGAVWATNHHSWWEFFVAASALRTTGRSDVGVLMDPANMGSRSLFGTIGVVGTDALRSALDLLRSGVVLVVFPEGELRAPGPLGPTRRGARWLADHAGVPLLPVATRVVLRGHQAAEAYVDVGRPEADDLAARLAELDREIATADPNVALPGFRPVITGVRSWHERFGGRMTRP